MGVGGHGLLYQPCYAEIMHELISAHLYSDRGWVESLTKCSIRYYLNNNMRLLKGECIIMSQVSTGCVLIQIRT